VVPDRSGWRCWLGMGEAPKRGPSTSGLCRFHPRPSAYRDRSRLGHQLGVRSRCRSSWASSAARVTQLARTRAHRFRRRWLKLALHGGHLRPSRSQRRKQLTTHPTLNRRIRPSVTPGAPTRTPISTPAIITPTTRATRTNARPRKLRRTNLTVDDSSKSPALKWITCQRDAGKPLCCNGLRISRADKSLM
jgi:hypothetical protein